MAEIEPIEIINNNPEIIEVKPIEIIDRRFFFKKKVVEDVPQIEKIDKRKILKFQPPYFLHLLGL